MNGLATGHAEPGATPAWSPECAAFLALLRVGARVRVAGETWTVAGRVLATDHEETWAECLLRAGGREVWLAVETLTGVPQLSLWRRGQAADAGFDRAQECLGGRPLVETGRGSARYLVEGDRSAAGTVLPARGELGYREYSCESLGERVAVAGFGPGGPLLVGRGAALRREDFAPVPSPTTRRSRTRDVEPPMQTPQAGRPYPKDDEWWSEFFGDIYTDADIEYQDPALTKDMVGCVGRLLPVAEHPRLLDLACGTGRHAVPLAAAGYRVTGADLSAGYLAQAENRATAAGQRVRFVRTDMRDLSAFADGSFDAVANLHTSFGFFHDPAEDQRVLDEVRRVLAPGGRLLIDVVNRDAFLRQTSEVYGIPEGRYVIRTFDNSTGRTFLHEEVFDPLTSRIRWTVTEPGARERTATADYRVFSAHELLAMLRTAGLRVESVHGDYGLSPFTVHSPNIVCLASAPAG